MWWAHFCLYLFSLIICNLTWLAYYTGIKGSLMLMFSTTELFPFVAKLFFALAAVPVYTHLFAPIDVFIKDVLGLYSKNNRLAFYRLKLMKRSEIEYFPRSLSQRAVFKLCYYHPIEVQEQMQSLNKDSRTVKVNKEMLFFLAKFAFVFSTVLFGNLTSQFSNAIFNLI